MAIQLVGSNLNQWGGNGMFETDRSTWGVSDPPGKTVTRSMLQKSAGLYSARIVSTFFATGHMFPCRVPVPPGSVGKKFLCRAKVFVPSSNPVAPDTDIISIEELSTIYWQPVSGESVSRTVLEATDSWVEVRAVFEVIQDYFLGYFPVWLKIDGSGPFEGEIFIDEFEVFEVLVTDEGGGEDPPPEPEPNPYEIDKVFFSKNPIVLEKTAPVGWQDITNYRKYNDIRVELEPGSGEFVSTLAVDLRPDSSGKIAFYQNEAFAGVFTFNPPSYHEGDIVRLTDRIKRFKNFTGDLSGTQTTPSGDLDESEINMVLWGGLSKRAFPGFNYFTTYMTEHMKFLTWAPVVKEVDRLQEDYLNFWVYGEFVIIKLQVRAFFDDGTDQTSITATKTGTLYSELYQIPAGPANSGVHLIDPTKIVSKYELCLLDQNDNVISETRTYVINAIRHPLTRYFMFRNSLGSFEVLRFTGAAEKQFNFNRTLNQKFLPHNYTTESQEIENDVTFSEEKTSYSSGFIKSDLAEDWHKYMKDFLLSTLIYDVTSGDRIPVVIAESEYKIEDQEYQRYIRFQALPAFLDECYTPEQ